MSCQSQEEFLQVTKTTRNKLVSRSSSKIWASSKISLHNQIVSVKSSSSYTVSCWGVGATSQWILLTKPVILLDWWYQQMMRFLLPKGVRKYLFHWTLKGRPVKGQVPGAERLDGNNIQCQLTGTRIWPNSKSVESRWLDQILPHYQFTGNKLHKNCFSKSTSYKIYL